MTPETIFPTDVPWATARMVGRLGVWGIIVSAFPNMPQVVQAVVCLCKTYADTVGGPYTSQLWADAFNWACEQLGYVVDYYA